MTTYRTVLTTYGNNKIVSAINNNTNINITHIAVGDGGGNPITPVASMTSLANEQYRTQLNKVLRDYQDSTKIIFEGIIPANIGGFVIREAGLFDSEGNLFAIANIPDITKPTIDQGLTGDLVIRLVLKISQPDVINLQIDPNVVVLTENLFDTLLNNTLNNIEAIYCGEY